MNNNQKAMLLHITIAALDGVKERCALRDARYSRLRRAAEKVAVLVDIYRPQAWPQDRLKLAEILVDEFNQRLKQVFTEGSLAGMLHLAMATYEYVRAEEVDRFHKIRLNNGIDYMLELLEMFDPLGCPADVISKADKLGTEFERRIAEVFGNNELKELAA